MLNKRAIIIVHKGYSKYLYYSIVSSKRTNPDSTIFLVGDKPYKKLRNYCTFVNLKEVQDEQSISFEKNYIHLGTSNHNFEMFCITRWFIYRNVMKKYNLEKSFCMDSDILLFSDIDEACKPFDKYGMSLMLTYGQTMSINNRSILDEFCDYILNFYTDENQLNKLKDMYYNTDRPSWGVAGTISDMTLSNMFFYNYKNKSAIGDISTVINDSVFDYTITTTVFLNIIFDRYEVIENLNYDSITKSRYIVKDIFFDNGHAYCTYRNNDGTVVSNMRFHSLHFVVWTKALMKYAFHYKKIKLYPIRINIMREYKVFKTKLKKIIKKII